MRNRAIAVESVLKKFDSVVGKLDSLGDEQVANVARRLDDFWEKQSANLVRTLDAFGEEQVGKVREHLNGFLESTKRATADVDGGLARLERVLSEISKVPFVVELREMYDGSVAVRIDAVEVEAKRLADAMEHSSLTVDSVRKQIEEMSRSGEARAAKTEERLASLDAAVKERAEAIVDELQKGQKTLSAELDGAVKLVLAELANSRAAAMAELAVCKTLIKWLIGAVAVMGILVLFCR